MQFAARVRFGALVRLKSRNSAVAKSGPAVVCGTRTQMSCQNDARPHWRGAGRSSGTPIDLKNVPQVFGRSVSPRSGFCLRPMPRPWRGDGPFPDNAAPPSPG